MLIIYKTSNTIIKIHLLHYILFVIDIQLLWNEEEGIWLDYDLTTKSSRKYFYTSNFAPLWTGSYERKLRTYYGKRAMEYLLVNGIINQDGTPKLICK